MTTPITEDNWRELLAGRDCPTCHAPIDRWTVEHNPNNNGLYLRCAECGLKHPSGDGRVVFLRKRDTIRREKPVEALADTWERCGGYCYGCGVDGDVLALLGIGRHQHHTRPYVDHGHDWPVIPLCTWCHGLITAHQAALRQFITYDGKKRGTK